MRIGHGYDVHRLVVGRPLVIGGVHIPHPTGLLGHSDADVLTHAVMDAVLGALGQGDIGKRFSPGDVQWKDADSFRLLGMVIQKMEAADFRLGNLDCTIVAQKPKLSPFVPEMRRRLAEAFRVQDGQVNVKVTTEEGLGFTGREEGIAAHAIVLLEESRRCYPR